MRREAVDWIHVAYYRDKWGAVVNAVMNFSGVVKRGKSLDCLKGCELLKNNSAAIS